MQTRLVSYVACVALTVSGFAVSGCGDGALPDDVGHEAAALGVGPSIRVGVVPSATSIALSGVGTYTIKNKVTGQVLLSGSNGTATVTLANVTRTQSNWRIQVMCSTTTNVAARQAAATAAGYPTHTELVAAANCTRLFIGSLSSNATTAERTALKNELVAAGLAASDAFAKLVTISFNVEVYRVTQGTTIVDSDDPVVLSASTEVKIANVRYRGVAEVLRNSTGTLAGVNELPMEHYLYGVVPRELGPLQWGQPEAQKAQAVAARSYGIRGLGKRAADGYDMLATVTDQVYGGKAAEHPISTAAVDATNGIVPTYQGSVISALFFSTSGGATANTEDVFSSPVAYLKGVEDRDNGAWLDDLPAPLPPPGAPEPADFEYDQSSYYRWTVTWTPAQMSEVITDYARTQGFTGTSVGAVSAIDVTARSNSGRVKTIQYVTAAGTYSDTKDRVRSSLKFFNASNVKTNLYSSLFSITIERDANNLITRYRADGGGFGHGVGLSQTGAAGMAERGYTFEEILGHYYKGVTLTAWY